MKEVSAWRNSVREEDFYKHISAVSTDKFSQGELTVEFEAYLAESLGVSFAVATTSGSVALLMALMACDIGRGDEVILPNRSSIASAHAPLLLGASLQVIDVECDSPIMDVTKIFSSLSRRSRAIIVPHPNGRCGKMNVIRQIAEEYDLLIIEDASQALFSRSSNGCIGTEGKVGCYSLGKSKLFSTGQGGVVVTQDEQIYQKLLTIRNHGYAPGQHHHSTQFGFNFKFTDVQAAIGLAFRRQVNARIEMLQEIYRLYADTISEYPFVEIVPVDLEKGELPLYIDILCEERDGMARFLNAQGIETLNMNPSLDRSEHLRVKGYFPNSEQYDLYGLRLPSGPGQTIENIKYVLEVIQRYSDVCHPLKIAC